MFALLERLKSDHVQTLGKLSFFTNVDVLNETEEIFSCKTLELPWLDNQKMISCIPVGSYVCVPYSSTKYPNVWEITNVPGRSKILIHAGNFKAHTKGCVLVGKNHIDVNGDDNLDVTNSVQTLNKIREITEDESFLLHVLDVDVC